MTTIVLPSLMPETFPVATSVAAIFLLSTMFSATRSFTLGNLFNTFLFPYNYFKQQINAWLFLFIGTKQIDNAYVKAKGKPFLVKAPDHDTIFVSSPEQVKEIVVARQDVLSLFAASKQMFQPQYTMHGFAWTNRRGEDGIGFVRTFRSLLTSHVPRLMPDLQWVIGAQIEKNYTKKMHAYESMKKMVITTVGFTFFDRDILPNQEFMDAAFDNIEHVIRASEAIRLLPKICAPLLGKLLSSSLKTQEIWFSILKQTVEQRLENQKGLKDGRVPKDHPKDVVQWTIDTIPREQHWDSTRIAHEVMALWFGSIHGLSITTTYALFDLCRHPEYVEPLRAELESPEWMKFTETSNGLPLLDSFIKESSRMNPMDYMTSRREALRPFTFADGTHVRQGDWTCVPVKPLMNDSTFYPRPEIFNGFRFTNLENSELNPVSQPEGASKLTDVAYKWGMWGNVRQACPARFFATVIVKLTLANILTNYDCELAEKNPKLTYSWRSYNLPNEDLIVLLKPRKESEP